MRDIGPDKTWKLKKEWIKSCVTLTSRWVCVCGGCGKLCVWGGAFLWSKFLPPASFFAKEAHETTSQNYAIYGLENSLIANDYFGFCPE